MNSKTQAVSRDAAMDQPLAIAAPPPPLPPRSAQPHVRQCELTRDGWRWVGDVDEPDPHVRQVVADKVKEHGRDPVAKILGIVVPTLDAFLNDSPVQDGTNYQVQARANQLEQLDRRADARARLAAQAKAG